MSVPGRCPSCGAKVVQKSGDGKIRIRTNIVAFDPDGSAEVVCKRCGATVPIDLQIGQSLVKALGPKLVLRK